MGIYMLDGTTTRTPGNYYRVDPFTGRTTSRPLKRTNEYIHASARSRIVLEGPGKNDRGDYDCKALQDYKLVWDDNAPGNVRPQAVWKPASRHKDSPRNILPEAPLYETEKDLLDTSPKVWDYVMGEPEPPKKGSNVNSLLNHRPRSTSRADTMQLTRSRKGSDL